MREIERDIVAMNSIESISMILSVLCKATGLGVAIVARVTETNWTACAVLDTLGLGFKVGDQLDLATTY